MRQLIKSAAKVRDGLGQTKKLMLYEQDEIRQKWKSP